jgi:DNA-directed RNA polymerase II subunit RPB1
LAALLNIKVDEKKQKCAELLKEVFRLEYSKKDLVVPNLINGDLIMQPRDNCYPDMMFEQIVSIEEVSNTTNYAYDLTVEDTRNFDCYNAVCLRDTFHLSGVASKSNVTRGVPRIEEILRLTKNPKNPSLTVYLKSVDELEKDRAAQYAKMLEHTKLVDVVKSVQICFDPNDRNTTILDDELLMAQYYEFEEMMAECLETDLNETTQKSRWILRMEMDSEALLDKNITMDDVHFAVSNGHSNDISCIYSDYNAGNLVFRIRLNSSVFNKTKKQKGIPDTLDQSDEIYMLRNFQEALLNNIVLRGVEGIRNVLPRKLQNNVLKDEGKYVQKDVWILDTTGTNLMEVMALDFIDGYRTFSNDIKEIFDVLGIEAARQIIYNEFYDVMEFSDVYINYHHLSLLCDRMTSTKDMVSIFRSGILNDDIGPISKATFEVQTEVLLDASKFAEVDYARGVSANVMLGQPSLIGTNSFGIVLDIEKMREVDSRESDTRNKAKELEKAFGLQDPSDTCGKAKIQIENNLTSIKAEDIGKCDDDGYDAGF